LLWRTASRVLRFSCAPLPRSHLFTLSLHDALPILIINDLCIFVSFYVFFKVSYNLIRRKETISLKQFRDIILGLYPIIIIIWICSWNFSRFFEYLIAPDRKSTRLNSSHVSTSYAVFCLKKKRTEKASVRQSAD